MELSLEEKQLIEREVSALLTEYGYSFETDTYLDIVNLAKKFGFIVGNAKLDDVEDGFIIIQPRDSSTRNASIFAHSKVIGVNANRPLDLKRFVIAHEFAHSVLHYNGNGIFLHRDNIKGKNKMENTADYFAAALLMPNESFSREYKKLLAQGLTRNTICYRLASIYKVPFESANRRINEISAVSAPANPSFA